MARVLTVLALAFLAGTAQAAVISYSQSLVPNPSTTDIHEVLSLPQFNPSYGTLTGVQITVNGSLSANAKYENKNTSSGLSSGLRMRLNLVQDLAVTMGAQSLLTMQKETALDYYSSGLAMWFQNITSGALTTFDGTVDYAGTSGFTTALWDIPASNTYTPGSIAGYTGTGTFAVNVDATAFVTMSTFGGNVASGTDSFAGTTVTVEYTYDIPEPTGLAMLALAGLALIRRR